MIRKPIVLRAVAALIALLLMAMSCTTSYDLRVEGTTGRIVIDGQDDTPTELPFTRSIKAGATVELTPVPDDGYEFVRWEGDASGSDVPLALTMSRDRAVTMVFEELETLPDPPSNDAFGDAQVLSEASGSVSGTTVAASKEEGEPNHAGGTGGALVWWSYQPTEDGTLTIDTSGSSIDTLLAVYTGSSVDTLSEVAADAGEPGVTGTTRELSVPVTAGTTYAIAVDGSRAAEGEIALAWRFVPFTTPQPDDAAITIDVTPDGADWVVREDDATGSVTDTGTGDGQVIVLPGSYHVSASLSGYTTDSGRVAAEAGEAVDISLTLSELATSRTLTIEASSGSGSVRVNGISEILPYSGDFEAGEAVEIEAVPSSGYAFAEWTGDVTTSDNPTTVVLTADRSVIAAFLEPASNQATLVIDVEPIDAHWTVRNDSASGSTVEMGSGDATLTVAPGTYHLTATHSLYADASDTVTLANGDDETVALSLTRLYQLTIQGSNGDVLVDGARQSLPYTGMHLDGTTLVLQIAPDAGYAFQSWSGTASDTSNPLTLTLDQDYTLTATTIDVGPPVVSILEPANGSIASLTPVEVTGVARDDETGIMSVEHRLDGGPRSPCTRPTSTTFRCVVTELVAGRVNVIEVVATDAAGNVTTASVDVHYEPTTGTGGLDIELVYFDESFTPSQKATFDAAVQRWQAVVVGGLQDVDVRRSANTSCGRGEPQLDQSVDDLLVFITSFTDAEGGVLAGAGPCLLRESGSDPGTPIVGIMEFDTADLGNLEANGTLLATIVHEMGHVLGLGSLWETSALLDFTAADGASNCVDASDYLDGPTYVGTAGEQAWQIELGGSGGVPVESTGRSGTKCSHWEESTFDHELMTGWLDGADDALSIVSVRALEDLGLTVDAGAADPYTLPREGALSTQGGFDLAAAELVFVPVGSIDPATGTFEAWP